MSGWEGMSFCTACGRPRTGTSRFCTGCGAALLAGFPPGPAEAVRAREPGRRVA